MHPDAHMLRILAAAASVAMFAYLVLTLAFHPDTIHFFYYGFDPP